jgi:predicted nuclease of predicted toxin-antitoxin system
MRLYLDDDSAHRLLVRLLRQAGHDVELPADVGMVGEEDPVHLTHAIGEDRVLLSKNHDDFRNLHNLILAAQGHHPGILIVRRDNDPSRDLKPPRIVRAIRNLEAAGVPIRDEFHVLNQWR